MEEEKKQGVSNIEKLREDLKSTKTDIEIINSARFATDDYDYGSIERFFQGGQAVIFQIKSKIDGKTYIGKRFNYQIGSKLNTDNF